MSLITTIFYIIKSISNQRQNNKNFLFEAHIFDLNVYSENKSSNQVMNKFHLDYHHMQLNCCQPLGKH